MARDPHDDLQARRLDLGLRESNLANAQQVLEHADRMLERATSALTLVQEPRDSVSAILFAQAHAAVAAAMYAQVDSRGHLDAEQGALAHERAHLEHSEAEVARMTQVASIRDVAMHDLAERLREAGFDPQMIGNVGIVLPKPDDEGPNT